MKATAAPFRFSSRLQRNWDWRAAGNFIGGGLGTGLVVSTALASMGGLEWPPLLLLGLALVGVGLFCVWLEIGRPWRALNVFRHFSTSWMSREAWVAPLLFITGLAALWLGPLLLWPSAFLAVVFLYSQARIMQDDKGIPAWRQAGSLPLMMTTGLAEGLGLLVALAPFWGPAQPWLWALLLLLLGLRAQLWGHYRDELRVQHVPLASQKALARIDQPLLLGGHLLPAALMVLAFALPQLAQIAGLIAAGAGGALKYQLICKAAFTQGFDLRHQPVRGQTY